MSPWKHAILNLYYHGTLPYRRWRAARSGAGGQAPVVALFYHRIADDAGNPCTISNREFAQQMDWLESRFDLISLEEAQRRLRNHQNRQPAVCITFDDGYAANCDEALPLLIERRIPCTYFVSSRCVLEGIPFPHDVASGSRVWPNTAAELRAMAAAGIDIGSHTRTHADLGRLHNPRKLYDEVVVAGQELQQAIGGPVRYFAFPYGQSINLNAEVFHLAHEYGYEGVCSAYGGYNFPGDDPFHIQRVHADNLMRLKNLVTIDPRKTSRAFRFDYQAVARCESEGAAAR